MSHLRRFNSRSSQMNRLCWFCSCDTTQAQHFSKANNVNTDRLLCMRFTSDTNTSDWNTNPELRVRLINHESAAARGRQTIILPLFPTATAVCIRTRIIIQIKVRCVSQEQSSDSLTLISDPSDAPFHIMTANEGNKTNSVINVVCMDMIGMNESKWWRDDYWVICRCKSDQYWHTFSIGWTLGV